MLPCLEMQHLPILKLIDEIKSDKYKKPKSVNYSHIGSIGNLSLELIKEKLKHFLKA